MADPQPWAPPESDFANPPRTGQSIGGHPLLIKPATPVKPEFIPGTHQMFDPTTNSAADIPNLKPTPPADKITYRPMTPGEKTANHLGVDAPWMIGSTGEFKLPEGFKAGGDKDNSLQVKDATDAADALVNAVHRARGFINDGDTVVGNTATGGEGNFAKHLPWVTDASKLQSVIDQEIRGNIFLKRIGDLKQENDSPTGGTGIGRVMQAEIPLLTGALGTLDPGRLGRDETLKSLLQIERAALRSKARLAGQDPDDPAVQQKFGIPSLDALPGTNSAPPPPGSTPNGSGNTPNGGGLPSSLTPDQQSEDRAFLATNPSPEQYSAFLATLINGPVDPKAAEARLNAAKAGGSYNGEVQHTPGHELAVGLGSVVQGAGDLMGMVSNPFIRAVNWLTGSNMRPDMGANLRDATGLPAPTTNAEKVASTISNYGTQAMGMAGLARAAAGAVPGIIGKGLQAFGERPLTDSASAASGGAASEVTRQLGGGPLAQTAAGIVAGVPVAGLAGRANAISQGAQAVPSVISAGEQQGIAVPRAMAIRSLEPKVIATGKTMTGAKVMGKQMGAVGDQIQARTAALGNGGVPLDTYNAGEKVQDIGKRYIQTSGAQFGRLYDKLGKASEGVSIQAQQSLGYIDNLLSRLNKTPDTNAKEITYLQGVRNDLARGLDVQSSRDIGSRLSRDIRKGDVTFGPMERDVLGLRQAVSDDVATGLASAGKPDVAAQFKQVDGAYQQRMATIRNTIQKLTGPRDRPLPPEQAAARIKAWASAKGDSASLEKIMAQATPEERNDIAATFADSLGRGRTGQFSTAALTSNIQGMPRRVRKAIFGEDGAAATDQLLLLANEHARVTKALGGSPTGLANDARSWVTHALFGSGGALMGGVEGGGSGAAIGGLAAPAVVMAAKIGRDAFSAKALMSPRITSWLRTAPKSDDPQAVAEWMNRLKVIAVREPALAPEVQRIQNGLVGAANSNITPAAAASEPNQNNGNE